MANLKSMNLKGEDIKTIVDSPVNSYFVKDDVLYYISCFDESLKGAEITDMSSYDYSIVALNLNTNDKKVISEKSDIILDMNISGDSVIMICYNRDEFFNYYSAQAAEDAVVPTTEVKSYDIKTQKSTAVAKEDIVSINVCDEDIFVVLADGRLARFSPDISSFKTINEDGTTIDDFVFQPTETEVE